MNKNVFGMILIFSIISTITIFMAMTLWAFNNDYLLYNLNVQAEGLEDSGLISQSDLDNIEAQGNAHASLDLHFDEWWLLSFIAMVTSVLFISYNSREEDLFSFLNILFFGSMIFMLATSIIDLINTFLIQDLFYKLLPASEGLMPMHGFYIANLGLINFGLFLLCISINRAYFKIQEFTKKKDMDISFSDEVV